MFEEALAAFRKDWVVLALAYQEKQNQSEGVEGNLGPFWLISWPPLSPDWTPQRGGPQYTCHPPIIAFSLCLSPFQFPFLNCQILWQKRFELWWVSLLQLLPPHTTTWSQQCLYSHPVASCYEILLCSGRAGLCPHTCSHPHTRSLTVHRVLYWTALRAAGPLSPDAHLSISKSLCISSLGLLWPIFLETSITLPGWAVPVRSWDCPVCLLLASLHGFFFSLPFHPVIYLIAKQNFHPVQRSWGHTNE